MAAEEVASCFDLELEAPTERRVKLEERDLAALDSGRRAGEMPGSIEASQEGFAPACVKPEPEGGRQGCWEVQWQRFLKVAQSPSFQRAQAQPQRRGSRDGSQDRLSPEEASDGSPQPGGGGGGGGGGEQEASLRPGFLLGTPDSPLSEAEDHDRVVKEEVPDAESPRQRFRRFCYQDAEGPRDVYSRLRELCHQWLEPDRHTKEQILELVILEQLLTVLPGKIQAWVREGRPESCMEAVALAEEFLLHQPEEDPRWEKQPLWPYRETAADVTKMASSDPSAWPPFRENEEEEEDGAEIPALVVEKRAYWKEKNPSVKTKGFDWILPVKIEHFVAQNHNKGESSENQHRIDAIDEEIDTVRFHPASVENPYTCWDCGESFSGIDVLVAHQSTHTGVKPFICSECGQSFTQRSLLIAHEKTHVQEKPFSCPECGQSFSKRAGLVSHQKIHTGEKPHHCTECTQSFLHRYDLIRHLRIHTGEKPHECPDCGKGLRTMSAFHVHRRIHTDEKPYPCSACGKSFRHRANLIVHERIHTGEKPYKCEDCNKRFGDASSLRKHQRSHTGEKPYVCPECGKRFSQNSGLVQHEKIHTGEKPFQCALCPKSFRDKSAIVAHQRTHTKERPYRCPVCGKCFGHRSNLIKHERIHAKKFKCL